MVKLAEEIDKVKNLARKSLKRPPERGKMGVYTSLTNKNLTNEHEGNGTENMKKSSKKAKPQPHLKPLPKEPIPRFFAHFRWERIRAYWFSKAGLVRIGKIFAACVLLGIIGVGVLFVYYKNQLKEIELNDLTISETVNTYYDRNGVLLWEDKGNADYRLVVEGDQIAMYARQATVAIEDRNFYSHPGVDLIALIRAAFSTLSGGGVQGGSTLTQQLIKQVYFADEAASANRGGLSRKIKELILAIELEKTYSKEQIITMYLNESPYGGRRNGIESAAQTYFGKSAKDLTLAESALLAAIPNNPGLYNPYNTYGNEALLARQRYTLDVMAELGYITREEADAAKEVAILDQILPESNQYKDIKAPHFVMEVKSLLEEKYGIQTMRQGGYTIKTSLDYRAQQYAEQAVATGASQAYLTGGDNIAMTSVDVETSQVIAMVGSIDWNKEIYGEVNAATSLLEPGSTIKPVLDYAPLLSLQGDTVWSPGSILRDEDIDKQYCLGTYGPCSMTNATMKTYGDITVRESLSNSLNIGAVKALMIVGIEPALETLHKLGDVSYCAEGAAGYSIAIGSGCGVRMVEHVNAYASLARGGTYKDLVYVLEVKDGSGKVLESWKDVEAVRVIDEQVAYELSSILSDKEARARYNFGAQSYSFGFVVPGVWTASKTGTTTTANSGVAKDLWMMSYSTAVATAVWNGNHDGSGLKSGTNTIVRRVTNDYMDKVHNELYASEGKWKSGDQPVRPAGIQDLTVAGKKDIWPSWYTAEKSGVKKEKVEFNSETKLKAVKCTPKSLRVEIEVSQRVDPVTGYTSTSAPEGYNYEQEDTCATTPDDDKPVASEYITITPSPATGTPTSLTIKFSAPEGDELTTYTMVVDNVTVRNGAVTKTMLTSGFTYAITPTTEKVIITVQTKNGKTHSHEYRLPRQTSTSGGTSE